MNGDGLPAGAFRAGTLPQRDAMSYVPEIKVPNASDQPMTLATRRQAIRTGPLSRMPPDINSSGCAY